MKGPIGQRKRMRETIKKEQIRKAAPALLEALEELLEAFWHSSPDSLSDFEQRDQVIKANAAIAAAQRGGMMDTENDWHLITNCLPPINTLVEFYDADNTMQRDRLNHFDKIDKHGNCECNYIHNYTHWRHLSSPDSTQKIDTAISAAEGE